MGITTLKKYLYNDNEAELRRIMSNLLKSIVNSAVIADRNEYDALKFDIERIQADLDQTFTMERLLVASGATMQALDAYNQRTTRFIHRQGAELQKMIKMLTESIIAISGSSDRATRALGDIKINLSETTALEDLQVIKSRLTVCLGQVCQESLKRQEEAAASIAELQQRIHNASQINIRTENDPVTSLPGRCAAEASFLDALARPGRKYLAVLVLDRLASVNVRFGPDVGNQVLAELARQVQSDLLPGDSIYRWSGPALVILLQRQCSIDRIRSDMKPVFEKQIQKEFNIGHRSVLIPIAPLWSVFGLVPPIASTLKHIDTVVASHTTHEYC